MGKQFPETYSYVEPTSEMKGKMLSSENVYWVTQTAALEAAKSQVSKMRSLSKTRLIKARWE